MKHFVMLFGLIATSALLLVAAIGCESTGGTGNTSSGTNYGTGMNDRWAPGGPSTTINPTTGASPGPR